MTDQLITAVVTVLTAIVGVAILAIILSGKSKTSEVLGAAGSSFATILGAATAPITGSGFSIGANFG